MLKKYLSLITSSILSINLYAASTTVNIGPETGNLKEFKLEQISVKSSDIGVFPNDSIDDSSNINKFINTIEKNKFYILQLEEGIYNLDQKIIINRSNLKIKGAGINKTKFIFKKETNILTSIFEIKGTAGEKIGNMIFNNNGDNVMDSFYVTFDSKQTILSQDFFTPFSKNIPVWLKQFNDKEFILRKLDSSWTSDKIELIQEINAIEYCSLIDSPLTRLNKILKCRVKNKLNNSYSVKTNLKSEIWQTKNVENIYLEDFSIIYEPNREFDFEKNQFNFSEIDNVNVDSIFAEFVSNLNIQNISIINSGRNPLVLDKVNISNFSNIKIENSFSKENDNGSVLVYRTFNSKFNNFELNNLKYFIVSWASGRNEFKNFKMNNPLYLKGGYTHNNDFSNFEITLNETTPFNELYENINFQDSTTPPNLNSNNLLHLNSFKVNDYRLIRF